MPRPLDLGGVELVDYRIKGVLKHAIHRVGLQLKREWKNLCHRHMGIRGLFKPDFQELGNLLNVDAEFLEANSLYAEDIRLEAAIVEGRALENSPSRVVLELRNPGGRPLKNIRVRVRAPGTTLKSPISQIRDLVPPETVRVDLDITPRTAPCCPLEVFIDLGDDPLEIPSFPIPVAIPVSPA